MCTLYPILTICRPHYLNTSTLVVPITLYIIFVLYDFSFSNTLTEQITYLSDVLTPGSLLALTYLLYVRIYVYMKNLIYHFPTCYNAYSVKEPIGELNLKRALDEDTGVFSLLSSSSPLGQTAVSGNSTLHQ